MARQIALRQSGRQTFMRIIEQERLAPLVDKSTASRLEKIMAKLPQVTAWRETLTESQQLQWASPVAVLRHCPAFAKPKSENNNKPLSPMAKLKKEYEELEGANMDLQEQLHKQGEWEPTDPVETIASALIEALTTQKARQVAEQMLNTLKKKNARAA
jgi:hypothetical protein